MSDHEHTEPAPDEREEVLDDLDAREADTVAGGREASGYDSETEVVEH
jgi:hypothetical protein